jgi:hypothetical protein
MLVTIRGAKREQRAALAMLARWLMPGTHSAPPAVIALLQLQ